MASQRSLYDVLNVAPDAEPVVVEAAYRALMKKYHPDQAVRGDDASSSAAEINRAFAILRNPARRAEYDRREGSRRQAFHLQESRLPPRQPRSAFGWVGWFVAMLLGIVLAVLINGRGGVVSPLVNRMDPRTAAAAEPDHRSQPDKIALPFPISSGPAKLDRKVATRDPAQAINVGEGEPERAALADPPPKPRRAQAVPRSRARPQQRGAESSAARTEEDFRKREGYIY